jgi:hypothetical protein
MRNQLDSSKPFYILYNLTRCKFNRAHMAAQEKVLYGATACAIILHKNSMLRGVVKVIASVKEKTLIRICDTPAEGIRWLMVVRKGTV